MRDEGAGPYVERSQPVSFSGLIRTRGVKERRNPLNRHLGPKKDLRGGKASKRGGDACGQHHEIAEGSYVRSGQR